jgi:hypothetical protein
VGDSPIDPATGAPVWAQANFDDSRWEDVDISSGTSNVDPINGLRGYAVGWTQRGHPGYWGYAWYRIRVQLEARPGEELALAGPADVDDVYQVFANGTLLGSFGGFSGNKRPVGYYSQPKMFRLPPVASGASGKLTEVLAFRVWMEPNALTNQPDAGGFHTAPVLGEAGAVEAGYRLRWLELVRAYGSSVISCALFTLLTIVALSIVLLDRSDPVYLWMAGVFALYAIFDAMRAFASWTQYVSYIVPQFIQDAVLMPLTFGGWAMLWWVWFRLQRPRWLPELAGGLVLLLMISNSLGGDLFFSVIPHPVAEGFHVVSLCDRLALWLLIVSIVIQGIRKQGWDGLVVLPAVLLMGVARFTSELSVLHISFTWFPFGLSFGLGPMANLLMVAGLTVLLIRRLVVSLREQRRMALDVKQAQEVQKVILPEARTQVTGLAIESVYRPAREVGGDFFQVIAHPTDGSVLIVAGDVTGKGLQAGMLVALLVGAIRSTADFTTDPQQVLRALNQRLMGRGEAHATCLALRIDADGESVLANAGHLPPYRNGQAIPVEGSLPLGMTPRLDCSVSRFRLREGDRLVLVSDGIAEARDAEGRLFGFERVEELLSAPAQGNGLTAAGLADAAQSFGQDDDISVIAVTRTAVLVGA